MEISVRRREQEVWQACDDLWAMHGQIKLLTGDGIRDRLVQLGKSRGSPNEIYKYRKTWVETRGITQAHSDEDASAHDPITRAVRMVHEQLKAERDETIASIKNDHDEKLREYEREKTELTAAIDKLVGEYGELVRVREREAQELLSLKEQHLAEIDLRKAAEREYLLQKNLLAQEKNSAKLMLDEIKAICESQREQFAQREAAFTERQHALIVEHKQETRALGHEYSESLMVEKIKSHNLEAKIVDIESRLKRVMNELSQRQEMNEALATHNQQLALELQNIKGELMAKKSECERILRERDADALALKRNQLRLARMRAMRS